jgi:hypothetical protein
METISAKADAICMFEHLSLPFQSLVRNRFGLATDPLLARGKRPAAATVQRGRTPPLTEQGKNTELLSPTRNVALCRECGTLGNL